MRDWELEVLVEERVRFVPVHGGLAHARVHFRDEGHPDVRVIEAARFVAC